VEKVREKSNAIELKTPLRRRMEGEDNIKVCFKERSGNVGNLAEDRASEEA
jgi:hypothetical protein